MKIDLHMHSTFSDGTFTVPQIVDFAKKNDFEYIAVTDHNNFQSVGVLKEMADELPRKIAGIELSTKHNGKKLHLLGYFNVNSDFNSEKFAPLRALLDREAESKAVQVRQMIDNLSVDYDVNYDEFLSMLNGDGFINRVHIARYLTDKGITESVSNAFKTIINTKSKYFVKRREMTFEEGLYAVVGCGGLPSIAHFVEYGFTDEEIDEIATITAKATDTVGVELWHYKQNADFRRQIIDRCKKYDNLNIIFTAGSDFHGANKVQNIGEISPDELTAVEQRFFDDQIKRTLEVFKNRNIIKDRD
ncbi:PHP domain-containing protein [uncultured Eubacterium sp.]|uniref:PHP domain-containing protein n=1 Tax=uncultured Eubacterium sp. TaxID=165185 RepID=UPI0026319965|nr:PHP domain-containing protein [uncultured Eubacterium sp.]